MRNNPYLEVVLAAVIWGLSGVFVKLLALPPTTIAFFRLAVPTVFLGAFLWVRKSDLFKAGSGLMFLASYLNAVRVFFYFVGFTFTSVGNAVIVLYTWPVFATVFSVMFLKERVDVKKAGLLFLAFLGILLVFLDREIGFANADFIGMGSMLLAAIIYAFSVIIFKKESLKYSKFETVFFQNLVGALIFLPFLFVSWESLNLWKVSVAGFYAFLIGVIGFGLFFSALKRIGASTASFLSYVEVVSGVVFGVVLLDEVLRWNMVAGGFLIVGASVLLGKLEK